MRVANKAVFDAVTYNLGNLAEEANRLNRIAATGKRISKLSDDPVGLTQTLDIKSSLAGMVQLGRNITFGKTWLAAAESALGHVQDLVSEAKVMAIQMASASTGQAERVAAAETIQNMLEEIISLGNTETNGGYIFAGSRTDAVPFDQAGTYNGDSNPFTVKIGRDTRVQVGSDGDTVFRNTLTAFSDLKTALESNDVAAIQTSMSDLDSSFDHMAAEISGIGSKMIRMDIKENILEDLKVANTARLSKIEDADIRETITQLKAMELAYQVAMATSARVMELNLFDYL